MIFQLTLFCHVDPPTTFVKTSVCDIIIFSFLNKTKTKPNKLKVNDQVQLLAYFYHQEPNQIS